MPDRRYSLVVRNLSVGTDWWITLRGRTLTIAAAALLSLPILIGLGAKWSAIAEIHALRASERALQVENGNYRATTGELTSQIQSLENVIDELSSRASV